MPLWVLVYIVWQEFPQPTWTNIGINLLVPATAAIALEWWRNKEEFRVLCEQASRKGVSPVKLAREWTSKKVQ